MQQNSLGKQAPQVALSPYSDEQVQSSSIFLSDLENKSQPKKKKKPALSPLEKAEKRIAEAIEMAINEARKQIHRRILTVTLQARVRAEMNKLYGDFVDTETLDQISKDVARSAAYGAADVPVLPKSLLVGAPQAVYDPDEI